MKKFTALLGLTLLAACSSKDNSASTSGDKIITANNFGSFAGWNTDMTLLDRGRAHSGEYAIRVNKDHEFSLTFDMLLGQATSSKIKTIHLEAWAYLPSDKATGVLGVQIIGTNGSAQLFGDGIRLGDVVKTYGKWVKVDKDIVLPDTITALDHIRLSLWRADASDEVLVDDVVLSVKD